MRITKYKLENPNILVKESSVNYETKDLTSPEIIVNMINDVFRLNKQAEEYLYMVATNVKGKLMGVFEISHGTVNSSLITPREVMIRGLLCGASNIILLHNHPSGDCTPSKQDLEVTNKIKEAADIVGINLLDHLIVGEDDYYSFHENHKI